MRRLTNIMPFIVMICCLTLTATTAFAEGDPVKGKKDFKKCTICHSIEEGKKKIGPSLFKSFDKTAGTVKGFKYSKSYVKAGEKGLKWDKENLIAYLENPKQFLKTYLDQNKVKTRMLLKVKKLQTRENIVAYLESLK